MLALAGCCGLLSLSLHMQQERKANLVELMDSVAVLNLAYSEQDEHPQRWIIAAHQLMPRLKLYANDAAAPVQEALTDLTSRYSGGEQVSALAHLKLQQQLMGLLSRLRTEAAELELKHAQFTHFYYLSVLVLVLALAAFLGWRLNIRTHSPLKQLLSDRFLFANMPVALSVSDAEDRLLRANSAFERLTGYSSAEMMGRRVLCEDSEEERAAAARMRDQLSAQGSWTGEYRVRCKDGSVHAEKVMRMNLGELGERTEGYLTISTEAEHSDAEQRLMLWQAHHDNLTKLPNSNLLNERLARALQEGKHGAVISIDLDSFKNTNDSLGHAGADRVLIEAAHRIAMSARESDTVARMGGDLFVIAITDFADISEVELVARSAVDAIAQSFAVEEGELFITASAGITIYPDDGDTSGELLQKADAARLDAKARGGNQLKFFEEEMNEVAARRFELETHLRKAIAGQEFELHFQPIVDISKEEIYGAEALLRWRSPQLGMVSPGEFIPVAEATGLIVDIGRWVVTEVQQRLAGWQESIPGLRVSLNVSARQLVDDEQVSELLEVLGREFTDQITVELTESALVQNESCALTFLSGLRDLKLHVALDDFGTGYSSVGYLRDYEFDVLKVDKSFIDGIDGARDLGLVASIVAMGRILGMRVVAEGVEEEDQVQRLKRIGCDFVQGFYYSKPLPAAEFEAFVLASRDAGQQSVLARDAG